MCRCDLEKIYAPQNIDYGWQEKPFKPITKTSSSFTKSEMEEWSKWCGGWQGREEGKRGRTPHASSGRWHLGIVSLTFLLSQWTSREQLRADAVSHFLAEPLDELRRYLSSDLECTLGGTILIVPTCNTGFHSREALGFLPGGTKLELARKGGTQSATAMRVCVQSMQDWPGLVWDKMCVMRRCGPQHWLFCSADPRLCVHATFYHRRSFFLWTRGEPKEHLAQAVEFNTQR